MKASELRKLSVDALRAEMKKAFDEAFKIRMQHANGKLVHVHLFKQIRKDIARIQTVMREVEGKA